MTMRFEDCFRVLVDRLSKNIVVTSAGNTSELWWEMTGETESVFYLEASMSLASLFAAGIARNIPDHVVVAFSGDGAFCMNPGMLMVERQLALPNLKHFMVSNRCYGSTNGLAIPFSGALDYAGIARSCGIERVYSLATVQELEESLDEIVETPGHTFTVLEVEPLGRRVESPPLDGPEVKFRFGRYIERISGNRIFDAAIPSRDHNRQSIS